VVPPPGSGRSVTTFWDWDTHEAQLLCPDEVDGDVWSTRSSTKLSKPWSPWESSPSRKILNCRTGNRTRDLMIGSQKLWLLDHESGLSLTSNEWNKLPATDVMTIITYL
jgi:hypothetical protein